jgi:hypothetical protein
MVDQPKTTDWIKEAEELCQKATPGPWRGDRNDGTVKYRVHGHDDVVVMVVNHKDGTYGILCDAERCWQSCDSDHDADELFILRARDLLPRALEAIRRLQGLVRCPPICASNWCSCGSHAFRDRCTHGKDRWPCDCGIEEKIREALDG